MSLLDSQLKNNSLSNAYIIEGEDLAHNLEYAKDFAKKVFGSYGLSTKLETNPDMEIIDKAEKMKRDEIASLSRIFAEALDKEDPYCKVLLEEISKEAAAVIDSIIKGLNFKEEVKVSYSGGVFNLGDRLIKKIEEKSKNKIKIEKPYTDPSEGALILAKSYSK